jgi:D-alanine-D-alanine ligase-like ATP-grasp enzyme
LNLTVVYESWRPHPLSWIHRMEAGSVAAELRRAGHKVQKARFQDHSISSLGPEPLLLRLSDPVMLVAAQVLTRSYLGPSASILERCYDKFDAYRVATANGVDCPITALGCEAGTMPFPLVLKPRRGSDSIGVRLLRQGPIPERARSEHFIAQQHIGGAELTIAVLRNRVGMPFRILLPEGTPYSFSRKYLLRPRRAPLGDPALAARVRRTALEIAAVFGVDWAARIDLIHETPTDRLCFLECDVAPLVGARSAFAASLEAAGLSRAEQLQLLLNGIAKES